MISTSVKFTRLISSVLGFARTFPDRIGRKSVCKDLDRKFIEIISDAAAPKVTELALIQGRVKTLMSARRRQRFAVTEMTFVQT
jgi:hypothetical protein